jgi:hypothetical protein
MKATFLFEREIIRFLLLVKCDHNFKVPVMNEIEYEYRIDTEIGNNFATAYCIMFILFIIYINFL